jgi:hypothetical protein
MSTRRKIQLLLWAYFWLLIFEGALRKWALPGLSTPLLLVREPIAIAALMLGWPYLTRRPWSTWVGFLWILGLIALFLAISVGHRDMPTALFGVRILWFHLPLIFLFAAVFTRDDILIFAKAIALVAIPMAVLIAMQYSLPQSHIVNVAPGGEEGAGFSGALGKFRPPGTFSFTNGLTEFYALAAACVLALVVSGPRPLPKWIWLSSAALVVALPVSISRALLFRYVLVVIATFAASALSGRSMKNFLIGGVVLFVVAMAATRLSVVQDSQKAFAARWEMAMEHEADDEGVQGVLEKRVGGSTVGALATAFDAPILGYGIGLGTNFGATRVAGKRAFLIGEGAWPTTLGELGPILGLALLGFRLALAVALLRRALSQAKRANALPLILGGYALVMIVMGGTAQPTELGFLVLGAGLMLAACNPTRAEMLAKAHRRDGVTPGPLQANRGHAIRARSNLYQS